MKEISTSLAIIGAGASGGALALFASRLGISTVLIDKENFPRYKPCGCGVTDRALQLIDSSLPPERIHSAEFNDGNLKFKTSSPSPISVGTRESLDDHICREAISYGALFLQNENVLSVINSHEKVQISTVNYAINCKLLAVATGVKGNLPEELGFDKVKSIPALEEELAGNIETAFRFDFSAVKGGYGWSFPKSCGTSSIGVLTTLKGVNLSDALIKYKESLGLVGAKSVRINGHPIPVAPVKIFNVGRSIVIGDAAGLVDPLTFEGLYYSYYSAKLAAESFKQHLDNPEAACKQYGMKVKKEIIPELKLALILSKLVYRNPRFRKYLFSHYGQHLTNAITDVFSGKRKFRDELLKPSNYFQLLLKRL
ncbi:MAG: FAD-dependent monooxygenase [Fibrobacteres bacterium]|nr:FAD-dependent monooxygenase [Fibrobacterota bacterium]